MPRPQHLLPYHTGLRLSQCRVLPAFSRIFSRILKEEEKNLSQAQEQVESSIYLNSGLQLACTAAAQIRITVDGHGDQARIDGNGIIN